MSDLQRFLLDRIADDMVDAADFPDELADPVTGVRFTRTTTGALIWSARDRAFSECDAKQALVERHHEYADSGFCDCCFDDYPCADLRTLGAIYDQHPDYREEWRP